MFLAFGDNTFFLFYQDCSCFSWQCYHIALFLHLPFVGFKHDCCTFIFFWYSYLMLLLISIKNYNCTVSFVAASDWTSTVSEITPPLYQERNVVGEA